MRILLLLALCGCAGASPAGSRLTGRAASPLARAAHAEPVAGAVGDGMKDVSPAAVYVAVIPLLTERARKLGYALAVHGSLGRDLDLVAVPWTEDAASAESLILELLAAVGWNHAHLNPETTNQDGTIHRESGAVPTIKPHGRRAWSIHFDNGLYLDVSVMPLAPRPA